MNRTVLITGSASGIGRATASLLQNRGHRVIGVDLKDADIEADLGTVSGRRVMVDVAERLSDGKLDGVVAAAGIARPDVAAQTLALNYFGAVATLEGLRPLLARSDRPRAVAICSTAALLDSDDAVLEACLADDEAAATAQITQKPQSAYSTSKRALSLWLRRSAVAARWAGAGILLNGVAPGVVETAMTAPLLADPQMLAHVRQANPMAVKAFAKPEEIAELIAFLTTFEGRYMLGQIIFSDGGTDALMRPDHF